MSMTPSLRDRLLEQFGEDLPIDGGPGLETSPIVVTAATLQQAVDVQMRVLHCLARGSHSAWRLISQEVSAPKQRAVRAVIESVMVREKQVMIHQEALWFVLEALSTDSSATSLPAASGFLDPRCAVHLPSQLGWLHLSGLADIEPGSPGVGWSVAYESLAMTGTVYVIDRQQPSPGDDLESQRVINEFRSAVADALSMNAEAEVRHQAMFRDAAGRGRCLLAIIDVPGDSMSAVLLTTRNGCFVKARLTFDATERQFGRMAHESMEAFVDAVRPQPTAAA